MEDKVTRAERREIERHKYYLSLEAGYDVGFEYARAHWLRHHAVTWRQEEQARMLALQREEINRHKWIESEKAHRDLGRDAVLDWIKNYAAAWRKWYETECRTDEH